MLIENMASLLIYACFVILVTPSDGYRVAHKRHQSSRGSRKEFGNFCLVFYSVSEARNELSYPMEL